MLPIVHGLEAEFGDRVQFVSLNAGDRAEGQQVFEVLGLPGHPSYVLFSSDGIELYRSFGMVDAETLRDVIVNNLQ